MPAATKARPLCKTGRALAALTPAARRAFIRASVRLPINDLRSILARDSDLPPVGWHSCDDHLSARCRCFRD